MGKARPRTVDPEAVQAERRELIQRLEKGFQQVQQSDEYRRYLETVSRFHQYSVSNTMLIWVQRPDATHVAGFRTWLSLGRHVLKGEKGIRIFRADALQEEVHRRGRRDRRTDRAGDRSASLSRRLGVRHFADRRRRASAVAGHTPERRRRESRAIPHHHR